MSNEVSSSLNALNALLGGRSRDTVYLCIRDLVEHGLVLARFAAGETTPQRQDITQYLAAWSRHAGLSEEEARGWLVDYCASLLASLSKRTPAAIRHSTKSNLRYIYRSAVPFLCHGANNPFRADCHPDCPLYADIQARLDARASELAQARPLIRPPPPVIEPVPPVKAVYREQFQTGLRLALEELGKGTKMPRIVEILNERGLKTRTGRQWTYGILRNELLAVKNSPVPPQDAGQGAGPPERPNAEPGTAPTADPAAPAGHSAGTEGTPSVR
jgi:hypothetical protein